MTEWKQYRRKGVAEVRPYAPGEDLTGINVSVADTPSEGDMIGRDPDNHAAQWYIAQSWFERNYEPVDGAE